MKTILNCNIQYKLLINGIIEDKNEVLLQSIPNRMNELLFMNCRRMYIIIISVLCAAVLIAIIVVCFIFSFIIDTSNPM